MNDEAEQSERSEAERSEEGEAERSEEGEAERSEEGEAYNARIHERLDRIEQKLDKVLAMLSPVHSHAEWVDGLRTRLHGLGLVRNTPRVTSE
jgi:uncharacterized protein YicC (UPF0701 family)